MKTINCLLFCLLLTAQGIAQDTFSIIAVDPETGEIGSAAATCVDGIALWGGIKLLNTILPGRGGVNAQASICLNPHINLDNAIGQMFLGSSPDEIINWLQENDECSSQNFNPAFRQYGIVDFDGDGNPRVAAFTGTLTSDYKGHITGPNYAIQGNILLGPEVLEQMEAGFLNTEGDLAAKLMGAMQGANIPGADSRCLARGTSSTSAFLRVSRPEDAFNDPFLELSILEMPFGEEPIDSLQVLYDSWLLTSTEEWQAAAQAIKVFPNPAREQTIFEWTNSTVIPNWTLKLYDMKGRLVKQQVVEGARYELKRNALPAGSTFIYSIIDQKTGQTQSGKLLFFE